MRRFLTFPVGLVLLLAACGLPPEQAEVADAYKAFAGYIEDGKLDEAFEMLSSNTIDFLDQLAPVMGFESAEDVFEMMMEAVPGDEDISKDVKSVELDGDNAVVTTRTVDGDEDIPFVREDGEWKVDFETLLVEAIGEELEGTGLSLEDIMAEGGTTTSEGDCPVTIVNDLEEWTIWYVYVDLSTSPWGEDRLGSDLLEPGESITVHVAPGQYDLKVVDEDDDEYIIWDIVIDEDGYIWNVTMDYLGDTWEEEGETGGYYETGSGSAPVTIYNDLGDWTIWYVHVDPSDSQWGDDRLGSDLLYPGDMITVWVDPGEYDLKVEDDEGDTYTLWNIHVGSSGYDWNVTLEDID